MPFVHKTQGLIPFTVWAGQLGMVGTAVIQHSEDRGRKIRKKLEVIANFASKKVSVVKDFNMGSVHSVWPACKQICDMRKEREGTEPVSGGAYLPSLQLEMVERKKPHPHHGQPESASKGTLAFSVSFM